MGTADSWSCMLGVEGTEIVTGWKLKVEELCLRTFCKAQVRWRSCASASPSAALVADQVARRFNGVLLHGSCDCSECSCSKVGVIPELCSYLGEAKKLGTGEIRP